MDTRDPGRGDYCPLCHGDMAGLGKQPTSAKLLCGSLGGNLRFLLAPLPRSMASPVAFLYNGAALSVVVSAGSKHPGRRAARTLLPGVSTFQALPAMVWLAGSSASAGVAVTLAALQRGPVVLPSPPGATGPAATRVAAVMAAHSQTEGGQSRPIVLFAPWPAGTPPPVVPSHWVLTATSPLWVRSSYQPAEATTVSQAGTTVRLPAFFSVSLGVGDPEATPALLAFLGLAPGQVVMARLPDGGALIAQRTDTGLQSDGDAAMALSAGVMSPDWVAVNTVAAQNSSGEAVVLAYPSGAVAVLPAGSQGTLVPRGAATVSPLGRPDLTLSGVWGATPEATGTLSLPSVYPLAPAELTVSRHSITAPAALVGVTNVDANPKQGPMTITAAGSGSSGLRGVLPPGQQLWMSGADARASKLAGSVPLNVDMVRSVVDNFAGDANTIVQMDTRPTPGDEARKSRQVLVRRLEVLAQTEAKPDTGMSVPSALAVSTGVLAGVALLTALALCVLKARRVA